MGVVLWLLYRHTRVLHRVLEWMNTQENRSGYRIVVLRSLPLLPVVFFFGNAISRWFPYPIDFLVSLSQDCSTQLLSSALVIYLGLRPNCLQKWRTLTVASGYLLLGILLSLLVGFFGGLYVHSNFDIAWTERLYPIYWLYQLLFYGMILILLIVWARFAKIQLVRIGEVFEFPRPVSLKFLMAIQLIVLLLLVVTYKYLSVVQVLFSSEWLKVSVPTFMVLALAIVIANSVLMLAFALAVMQPISWQRRVFQISVFYAIYIIFVFFQGFVLENYVYDKDQMDVDVFISDEFDFSTILVRIGWLTYGLIPTLLAAIVMNLGGLRLVRRRGENSVNYDPTSPSTIERG